MMDKDTAAELIQAKALGCLDNKSRKELNEYLNLGGDFSWKEYGEFQNLTSLLPIILEIEIPDISVKDKVAKRIYDAIAEQKAKRDSEAGGRNYDDGLIYPETTVLGDPIFDSEIPGSKNSDENVSENVVEDHFKADLNQGLSEEIRSEMSLIPPDVKQEKFPEDISSEGLASDNSVPSDSEVNLQDAIKKNLPKPELPVEKNISTPVQSKYRTLLEKKSQLKPIEEIPLTKEKYIEPEKPIKKTVSGLVVNIIVYILLLAAIAFVYFKLSSAIDELKTEIDRLKQDTSSLLIEANVTGNQNS